MPIKEDVAKIQEDQKKIALALKKCAELVFEDSGEEIVPDGEEIAGVKFTY